MASTFLEWLTKPNPIPNSEPCNDGISTKIPTVYGPHKVQPWAGISWENLNATFGDILQQQAGVPRIKDRNEVDREKLDIYEEESVTSLVTEWNEKIVQHGLDGTREFLMASPLKQYLDKGTIHFTRNTGMGHIPNEKGISQKPDWCIYQRGCDKNGSKSFTYLVPGDSKPATKWQSSWIDCDNELDKRKADRVLQQLTKYMYLSQTKYGFVISEEELVPLRLSTFDRSLEALDPGMQGSHARQIASSTGVDFEAEEELEQGLRLEPHQRLAEFLADAHNQTGLLLEYCRIPWSNHGNGHLTINLTLWWLPILAVQDPSVPNYQDHKLSRKDTILDGQPVTANNSGQRTRYKALRRSKRKAKQIEQPISIPKLRRSSRSHLGPERATSSQPRLSTSVRSTRGRRGDGVIPEYALRSSPLPNNNMSSDCVRRKTNIDKVLMAESFTSVEFNSQATDSVAVSFASSV